MSRDHRVPDPSERADVAQNALSSISLAMPPSSEITCRIVFSDNSAVASVSITNGFVSPHEELGLLLLVAGTAIRHMINLGWGDREWQNSLLAGTPPSDTVLWQIPPGQDRTTDTILSDEEGPAKRSISLRGRLGHSREHTPIFSVKMKARGMGFLGREMGRYAEHLLEHICNQIMAQSGDPNKSRQMLFRLNNELSSMKRQIDTNMRSLYRVQRTLGQAEAARLTDIRKINLVRDQMELAADAAVTAWVNYLAVQDRLSSS